MPPALSLASFLQTVAVRVAQKLSRKLVYAQMYKAQLIQLAGQAGPIAGPVSVAPELITGPPSASAAAAAAGGSMVAPGMRGPPPPPPMGGALGAAGVMMPPPPPVMMQTAMQGGLVQPTGWPPQARFDPLAAQHAAQAGGQAGGVGPSGVGQQADDGATITALTQAMQGLTTGGRVMQPDWQRLGGPVDDGSEGPGR